MTTALASRDATLAIVTEVFRNVFMDDGIVLKASTMPDDIPGWDSLTNISLILALQRALGVTFTTRELGTFRTVGDMLACATARRGEVLRHERE